jgi:hypothetical protein
VGVDVVEVPDPDEDLDELPPHAAKARQTAANNMSHMERFIDILLRSRF